MESEKQLGTGLRKDVLTGHSPPGLIHGALQSCEHTADLHHQTAAYVKSTATSINVSIFLRLTHVLIIPRLILQGFINRPPVTEFPRQIKDY